MNILFLLGSFPSYGGTEKVTTVIANNLSLLGHNVHIVSFEQKNEELLGYLEPNISVHKLSYPVLGFRNYKYLRSTIKSYNINIVINQWCLPFHTSLLINLAKCGLGCKLVCVLHGIPDKSKRIIVVEDKINNSNNILCTSWFRLYKKSLNYFIKKNIQITYINCDSYVLLSERLFKSFGNYSGISDFRKLKSIENPITIPVEYKEKIGDNKKKQILYVGRMDMENKRVNRIIEVWENIHSQYPQWELILVGDGPHKPLLEKYVEDKSISNVTFVGFIKEEPIQFYKNASIFMLTSDLEGFGLVLIEAMSYGVVPIVYGSYESVYDIIDDNVNGFITPVPYSKTFTIEKLKLLMDNNSKRIEMAHQAILKSKQYSVNSIIDKWEKLFTSI